MRVLEARRSRWSLLCGRPVSRCNPPAGGRFVKRHSLPLPFERLETGLVLLAAKLTLMGWSFSRMAACDAVVGAWGDRNRARGGLLAWFAAPHRILFAVLAAGLVLCAPASMPHHRLVPGDRSAGVGPSWLPGLQGYPQDGH